MCGQAARDRSYHETLFHVRFDCAAKPHDIGERIMIIRTKSGSFRADNAKVLLDFLGVNKETAGVLKVDEDVELIATAHFIKDEGNTEEGFAWTFSTYDLDRCGERIDPHGWDYSRFLENPVIEWAHRYDIPAIGKAENLFVDESGLHGFIVFNDKEYDPFGWSIGQRVKAGVIRAGSVGFRVMEIEIPSKEDSRDGTSLIFRKQELLEFSICNVPANPFALARKEKREERKEKKGICGLYGEPAAHYWGGLINNL